MTTLDHEVAPPKGSASEGATLRIARRPHHQPVRMGAPDQPHEKCRTCRVAWPCPEAQRLDNAKEEG